MKIKGDYKIQGIYGTVLKDRKKKDIIKGRSPKKKSSKKKKLDYRI